MTEEILGNPRIKKTFSFGQCSLIDMWLIERILSEIKNLWRLARGRGVGGEQPTVIQAGRSR